MATLFVQLYLSIIFAVYANTYAPELKIEQGILRGQHLKTVKGRIFSSYTAIPYAQPPIGDLRFKVALHAGPWNGILNASRFHTICTQTPNLYINGDTTVMGDEDCLYLNVYTPQLKDLSEKLLPVMIFFHGGSFLNGDANRDSFNPDIFLDKNIVLVVPNYRLGPFGFFSTGDEVVPGNNGLKDQNLAIKWVKRNIYIFGGDPQTITVFGESAGGASAHLHMLSPLSKNLINGVICQSGNALSAWAVDSNYQTLTHSRKLAQLFNCPTNSSHEMVKCLRTIDAYKIIRQQEKFFEWHIFPLAPFKVVVEPNISGAFLTAHPIEIIKSGNVANIPVIMGANTEDGGDLSADIFGNASLSEGFIKNFYRIAPFLFEYRDTAIDEHAVTNKIKEFYFDNRNDDISLRKGLTNMYTDGIYFSSINNAVHLHLKFTNNPIYYYIFGYRGTVSFTNDPSYDYGVVHKDELLYLFNPKKKFPIYKPSIIDQRVSEIMITLWTDFATIGNPTPNTSLLTLPIWQPVHSKNFEYYLIKSDTDIKMRDRLYSEEMEFWKILETNLGKHNSGSWIKSELQTKVVQTNT